MDHPKPGPASPELLSHYTSQPAVEHSAITALDAQIETVTLQAEALKAERKRVTASLQQHVPVSLSL